MDLALNYLQSLICHKTQPTNQPINACPVYDSKQSDSEVPVVRELSGMRITPSLPSLPGPLCLSVIALDRVISIDQIELYVYLCQTELLEMKLIIYIKMDLALNNLQRLNCPKTQPNNQPTHHF